MPQLIRLQYSGHGHRPRLPARNIDAAELAALTAGRQPVVTQREVDQAIDAGLYRPVFVDESAAAGEATGYPAMSNKELMAELDARGIEHKKREKNADLVAALEADDAAKAAAAADARADETGEGDDGSSRNVDESAAAGEGAQA